MEARRKVGKYGQEAKYKTLDAVLGIRDDLKTGGFASQEDLTDAADDYLKAVIEAQKTGKAIDVTEWLEQRKETEADFRMQGEGGNGRDDW